MKFVQSLFQFIDRKVYVCFYDQHYRFFTVVYWHSEERAAIERRNKIWYSKT